MLVLCGTDAIGAPTVSVSARMFLRETGKLDSTDLLAAGKSEAKIYNLDYGVLAREMLIDVAIPADAYGQQLTVVATQGKSRDAHTWKIEGDKAAHYPLLVSPTFCGGLMTITVTLNGQTQTRRIDFACNE